MSNVERIPVGTKVRHSVSRRAGVVHAHCPDPFYTLVRYGKETRPTVTCTADLLILK